MVIVNPVFHALTITIFQHPNRESPGSRLRTDLFRLCLLLISPS